MKIKFLDVNILLGGQLWDNLVEFVKKENPDIITMQEVYHSDDQSLGKIYHSDIELPKVLGYPYSVFAPEFKYKRDGVSADTGNMVLSKFPITHSENLFYLGEYSEVEHITDESKLGEYPRALQYVAINLNGKDLNIFNLHGVVNYRGDFDSPERLQMSKFIISRIKDKQNVILAGDSNAQQTTRSIMDIEQYLHSVFGRELKSTFNMRRKDLPGYASAAVDLIMVSPNIKVLSKECLDVDISDHYPLLAELEI